MPDGDDSDEREYGGFVFENDESAGDDGSNLDDSSTLTDRVDTKRVAAALLLSVAVIVLAVVVVQPLVTGAATQLFNGNSSPGSGSEDVADTTIADETSSRVDTTEGTTRGRPTTTATTATRGTATSVVTTATPTVEPTATPGTTRTAEDATDTTTASADTTAGDNATATPNGSSPAIRSFTVTDRSAGGNASFVVAWNVTDPDIDLRLVEVTVVADPDGEARTVARRRFDAGGQSTVGNGTFTVAGGSGDVYEVRLEVRDGPGNSVFALRREVADGEPDS